MDNCVHCLKLTKECTCKSKSDSIAYTGPNLLCTAINTNDNMTLVIQKLNDAICPITTTTSSTSSTSTSTTTTTTTLAILEFNVIERTVWNNGQGNLSGNTSFGESALISITTGNNNTAIGNNALGNNTIGTENCAFGSSALINSTTGNRNTALGLFSIFSNDSGSYNTGIGAYALVRNSTGVSNVSVGDGSLYSNISGNNNVALGYSAGAFTTAITENTNSSYCIFLGSDVQSSSVNANNEIVIGYLAKGLGNNSAMIGNSNQTLFGFYGQMKMLSTPVTGDGTEMMLVRKSTGEVKQVPSQIIITTIGGVTDITNATTDATGNTQNGKIVLINNAGALNYTINGPITASFMKIGTTAITFIQGVGRTLVQVDNTAVFNGLPGSTATLTSFGTTDYLRISNA